MASIRKESILGLESKIEIAKVVIRFAFLQFRKPVIVWSAGKDSTVVLGIVKRLVEEEGLKMPQTLFIDHGDHYPETLEMLDNISQEWNIRVIKASNKDVLENLREGKIRISDLNEANISEIKRIGYSGESFEYSLETEVGNHLLKTVALKNAIKTYGFDALLTGVRWDENSARSNEVFLSPRSDPDHIRVHPILTFLERDIWKVIFEWKLPIHPKYREGYRSIDGIHDSKKISNLPAWEQNLDETSERAGRSQDKEGMMEKLRSFGYM